MQRLLPLLLGRKVQSRIPLIKGYGKKRRQQGHRLFQRKTRRPQDVFQLIEFEVRRISTIKTQPALQVHDDGIEGTVGVVGVCPGSV
jgi:hypothetical protein